MLKQSGILSSRICTVCALFFCAVILLQNLLSALSGQPLIVLTAFLAAAGILFLCVRFLQPFRGFAPALFLVRFALALFFILWLDSRPVQDFDTMYTAAVQLAQGDHTYLDSVYFFNWAYQSAFVAYESLIIRLFGSALFPLQLLNAVYLAGTNVLVYLIARRLLSQKAAMTIGVLYTIYPAPLFLAGVLTNQHLSVFLFYLAVYVLLSGAEVSPLRFAAAGAIIALGNAIRPIGVILVLAALIWSAVRAMHQKRPALLLSALSVAVSYALAGALLSGLIISSGVNPEGLTNNQPMWKFVVGLNQESCGSWNRSDYDTYLSLPAEEANAAMTEAVKERLSVGPAALARLAWRKSTVMWAANEDLYWGFGHKDPSAPALTFPVTLSWNSVQLLLGSLDKGVYLLAFTLALFSIVQRICSRETCGSSLLLVLLLCGYYAVHLIVEVQSRYRYFLMPCIFLLAGMAIVQLPRLRAEKRKNQ